MWYVQEILKSFFKTTGEKWNVQLQKKYRTWVPLRATQKIRNTVHRLEWIASAVKKKIIEGDPNVFEGLKGERIEYIRPTGIKTYFYKKISATIEKMMLENK